MAFRDGSADIWMGTDVNSESSVGALRFIFRLTGLTEACPFGNISVTVSDTAVEGFDVFIVDGQTRSKFYSSERFIDQSVYRAIDLDETLPRRALVSFFDSLGLTNYVPISSHRGYVKGTATGVSSSLPIVVHWYNDDYQFWSYASSAGDLTPTSMPAGVYIMNLYQNEFLAASKTVSVLPSSAATDDIPAAAAAHMESKIIIFKLREYDGQPAGFLNTENQLQHECLVVADGHFKGVNNGQKVSFFLSDAVSFTATPRIATTLAFTGGRPQTSVNSHTCSALATPTKIDSRGVTRGAYRGYGEIYECEIPAGALVRGANTVTINIISGSSGDEYSSPNVICSLQALPGKICANGICVQVFDAIELFYGANLMACTSMGKIAAQA
ncbi:family 4 polysaccharide lyase [Xylaria nigripes]|nr:family 4 polysaccharide lyase [Xylaria nigripes]